MVLRQNKKLMHARCIPLSGACSSSAKEYLGSHPPPNRFARAPRFMHTSVTTPYKTGMASHPKKRFQAEGLQAQLVHRGRHDHVCVPDTTCLVRPRSPLAGLAWMPKVM